MSEGSRTADRNHEAAEGHRIGKRRLSTEGHQRPSHSDSATSNQVPLSPIAEENIHERVATKFVIASAAKQSRVAWRDVRHVALDCFAALAMTVKVLPFTGLPRLIVAIAAG
jgi:hypothetical protein